MNLNEWLAARRADSKGRMAYELVSGGADPERASALRANIETAAAGLDDEAALAAVELFPLWKPDHSYAANDRVRWENRLFRCVQGHTSQADWTPDATPALWTAVAAPGEIPVWAQPTGAQDAYMQGDRVRYPDESGDVWVSDVDNNVWQPGVYGWTQATGDN